MIRFARIFTWLRWRLLVNGLRGRKGLDAIERASRISAVVFRGLILLLLFGSAAAIGASSLFAGWMVGSGAMAPTGLLLAARILLLIVLVLILLVPLGGATHSSAARSARLLLLPIQRRLLHGAEVLAGLADPWVAALVPAILLLPVALAAAGRLAPAGIALVGGVGMIAVLVALGALVSFLLSWLLRSRRRAEAFTLVFVLVLGLLSVAPVFVSESFESKARRSRTHAPKEPISIERIDRALPLWTAAIPSELYGRAIGAGLAGRRRAAWLGVGALLLEAGILYALSSAAHRKVLDSAGVGGRRGRAGAWSMIAHVLPGLTPGASAVAFAQLQTALRSVRGRLVLFMPGPLFAMLALVSRRLPSEFPGGEFLGSHGHAVLGMGIVFSLYALQGFTMNMFASDRAGLTMQFLAPLRDADLVKGKVAGCAMFLCAQILLCMGCALLVAPLGSPLGWLTVLLGGAATYFLIGPVGALFSALFPVASDLSKTGPGGNPHSVSMLVGSLLLLLLSAVPAGILGIVHHTLERPGLALLLVAVWTLVAAALAVPLLRLAARSLPPRRETLALVAQGR